MAKILLVDDETALTDPLSKALRHQGYTVDVAPDGTTGLARAIATAYDLLILDWMLPPPSGLDICREIRQRGQVTPVLFLTAKDTLDDRVAGLDAGADDYLVKPFELRELSARVRALLRRSPVPMGEGEKGGFKLDEANQVVYCQGERIPLSEKEVQLLALFLQFPHQLLTHDQIYQALWPQESPPNSNVLAALVRLLRRKLERTDGDRYIYSVYGRGYRFEAPQPLA